MAKALTATLLNSSVESEFVQEVIKASAQVIGNEVVKQYILAGLPDQLIKVLTGKDPKMRDRIGHGEGRKPRHRTGPDSFEAQVQRQMKKQGIDPEDLGK